MVQYKLYYFPFRGRAEVVRLIFAHAGVNYEDIRIPATEWPKHKSSMPLGQMPVLEIDGVKLSQSGAIVRYLAKKYNLLGKTDMDTYWANFFSDTLDDIGRKYPSSAKEGEKRTEELKKEFINEIAPEGLQKIEKVYQECNKGKGCFLVGEQLTFADLALITYLDFLSPLNPNILSGAPGLEGVCKRVKALPKIKAWIDKRPKTEF